MIVISMTLIPHWYALHISVFAVQRLPYSLVNQTLVQIHSAECIANISSAAELGSGLRDYTYLRWPRRAMSITNFNISNFQFRFFLLLISNSDISNFQIGVFSLPTSNFNISNHQFGIFSVISNVDIFHFQFGDFSSLLVPLVSAFQSRPSHTSNILKVLVAVRAKFHLEGRGAPGISHPQLKFPPPESWTRYILCISFPPPVVLCSRTSS